MSSLFMRFPNNNGSKLNAPNTIREDTGRFISELLTNKISYMSVHEKLCQYSRDCTGEFISTDSTWIELIKEVYELYDMESEGIPFKFEIITELLGILIKEDTIESLWKQIKECIISHIDYLSLWTYSRIRSPLFIDQEINRDEEGYYFINQDNEVVGVNGLKTLSERKFDHVVSAIAFKYNPINSLIKAIALAFIEMDYKANKDDYPKTVEVFLHEDVRRPNFIHWNWYLNKPFGYTSSKWRPINNYCDPEWLENDLLATYSETQIDFYPKEIYDLPCNDEIEKYEKAFAGYERQLNITIDTHLKIGFDKEVYLWYRDRYIRWINGNKYNYAMIVVPTNEIDSKPVVDFANEFLSSFVWTSKYHARKVSSAGFGKRYNPLLGAKKSYGGLIHNITEIDFANRILDDNAKLALAFYKEGVNSVSLYYSFLSYYKIIELYFEKNKYAKAWILSKSDWLEKYHKNRMSEIKNESKDIAKHLYNSRRCAIAHASDELNPDHYEDIVRVSKDVPLIRMLSELMIQEQTKVSND